MKLAKLLGAFVMVDLYFFGCDLLTEAFPGGSGAEVVAMLVSGPLAPYFWTEIVGCAACAVICFVPALRTNTLLVIGSLLAIAGIFCKRVQLLVGGFQIANLDCAGPADLDAARPRWESGLSGRLRRHGLLADPARVRRDARRAWPLACLVFCRWA